MFKSEEYKAYKDSGKHGVMTRSEEAIQLMYLIDIKKIKFLEARKLRDKLINNT